MLMCTFPALLQRCCKFATSWISLTSPQPVHRGKPHLPVLRELSLMPPATFPRYAHPGNWLKTRASFSREDLFRCLSKNMKIHKTNPMQVQEVLILKSQRVPLGSMVSHPASMLHGKNFHLPFFRFAWADVYGISLRSGTSDWPSLCREWGMAVLWVFHCTRPLSARIYPCVLWTSDLCTPRSRVHS